MSYADVRRRARQIVKVTRARVMPPWPPVEGHGDLQGRASARPAQIATLARWVEQGALEGAPIGSARRRRSSPPDGRSARRIWCSRPTAPGRCRPRAAMCSATSSCPCRSAGGDSCVRSRSARATRASSITPTRCRIAAAWAASVTPPIRSAGFAGMDLEIASDRFEPDSHFLFWKPGTPAEATSDPHSVGDRAGNRPDPQPAPADDRQAGAGAPVARALLHRPRADRVPDAAAARARRRARHSRRARPALP